MIGIGKWACNVSSMFFSGEVKFIITDEDGSYGFVIDMPNLNIPDFTVKNVEEDGNTLTVTSVTSLLPGKEVEVVLNFDGDAFDGFLKIPFLGKVKFKDGYRIAE